MTSVLRCSQCGFDASAEHFKGDLCSMCAEPVNDEPRETNVKRVQPYGPMVLCRCGCGERMRQYSARGYIRFYAGPGHYNRKRNNRERSTQRFAS